MIDFWEAIGRLATYKDLNNDFLSVLPPVGVIPHVSVHVQTLNANGVGLDIPQKQYEAVQNFFQPILTENYLSLMAAGELIMGYSAATTREGMSDLLEVTSQAEPEVYGPSTRYFITLGIAILDELFRKEVTSGADSIKTLRRLADRENARIMNLVKNPKFEAAAELFSTVWDGGCDARIIDWPCHLHPVGIDATWSPTGNGTGMAGKYQKSTTANAS